MKRFLTAFFIIGTALSPALPSAQFEACAQVGSALTTRQLSTPDARGNYAILPKNFTVGYDLAQIAGAQASQNQASNSPTSSRSVKDFGAICDGKVNDHDAIQAALYASVAPFSKPFIVEFPSGICHTETPLLYTCASMRGQGYGLSWITGGPGQDTFSNLDPADGRDQPLSCVGADWAVISNLTIAVDVSVDITKLTNTISSAIGAGDASLTLTNPPQYYRDAGYIKVDKEVIQYRHIAGSTLSKLIRGSIGSIAVAHKAAAPVKYLGDLAFAGQGSAWANGPWTSSPGYTPPASMNTTISNRGGSNLYANMTSTEVASVRGMAPTGVIQVGDEFIGYKGIKITSSDDAVGTEVNTLTGLTRGLYGSPIIDHKSGSPVFYSSYLPAILRDKAPVGSTSLSLLFPPIGFPPSGTLLIEGEYVPYSRVAGATISTSATKKVHSPAAIVQVVASITDSQTDLAITNTPINTPLGYADFRGLGEVVGAIGIDLDTPSEEAITYKGGEPHLIPGSTPPQYLIVYHDIQRGQNTTQARAHSEHAELTAVNPFTFLGPRQHGTSNGVIPAWNIGNCAWAQHMSNGNPPNPGKVWGGWKRMDHVEFVAYNSPVGKDNTGAHSCGILFQHWPYQASITDFHVRFEDYGIVWALAGANDDAQTYSKSAGWINNAPFTTLTRGAIETPVPLVILSGPQTLQQINIESAADRTAQVESLNPIVLQPANETGGTVWGSAHLSDITGEFNLGNVYPSGYYPLGEFQGGLIADGSTSLGSLGLQPFYFEGSYGTYSGGFAGLVTVTGHNNVFNGPQPTYDYGADNIFNTGPTNSYGFRNGTPQAQVERAGQSRPDAFDMGLITNNSWFPSLADLMILPEDQMGVVHSSFPTGSTLMRDPLTPLGRQKAMHVISPGSFGGFNTGGDTSVPLWMRLGNGRGIVYIAVRTDVGTTTQPFGITGTSIGTKCNISNVWSVCKMPYDLTLFPPHSAAYISAGPTDSGTGIVLGPIVFSPTWGAIYSDVGTFGQTNTSVINFGASTGPVHGLTTSDSVNMASQDFSSSFQNEPGCVLVDVEIVCYSSTIKNGDGSLGFQSVKRGQYGTAAVPHKNEAPMSKFFQVLSGGKGVLTCTSLGCNFGSGQPRFSLSFGNGNYGGDTFGNWTTKTVSTMPSTPASSNASCTTGQMWSDSSYIYVCTAPNVVKRASLVAF